MESPQVAELNEDIVELNKLLAQAVRENVKEKIKRCIENTTVEIAKLKLEESQTPNKITEKSTPLNDSNISYSSVQSFAWNQEGNKVTVFLTVKDIHNIDKDKICAEFNERSFEIKMHEDQKYWDNLHFKESPMSKIRAPKMDEQAEPSTMLMNMMKQLYQEGDSDMKRTIAKAWCEANEKKSDFSVPNF
ncbi:calcyclin binding protein [Plasmodium cynomolgi strain B]|uniref:Calcyclin binding protein n=1 Tax=Plasmodium cynomolgi (strain B) TaxID=1120755 RepID=K6UZ43_PLACD|nr:calcyclin binding protein [Plasmodium cynomolgi strain B]GAB69209.1 calcyclin binding protein [Plasmodium cynomolgi strain B]